MAMNYFNMMQLAQTLNPKPNYIASESADATIFNALVQQISTEFGAVAQQQIYYYNSVAISDFSSSETLVASVASLGSMLYAASFSVNFSIECSSAAAAGTIEIRVDYTFNTGAQWQGISINASSIQSNLVSVTFNADIGTSIIATFDMTGFTTGSATVAAAITLTQMS